MSGAAGLFISFEGVEGAGKSTQIRLLAERLRSETVRDVVVTREPGGDSIGAELRRIVLHPPDGAAIDARAELLIMLADRAQHVFSTIRPALARGAIVVCDRYADSSVAYQGFGRGLDVERVKQLNAFATDGVSPVVTILLDLDPEAGLARQNEKTRMEGEAISFHQRVRDGFLELAAEETGRISVVDASGSAEEVADRVWQIVQCCVGTP